jgi:acetolactate decarboxylase
VDGVFDRVHLRAVCKATGHERLVDAAARQAEFSHTGLEGTLVGFWTPAYAKNLGIPGYHLHFISADRKRGGHVLDCAGSGWRVQVQQITDFRMAIPETKEFLQANLTRDPSRDLEQAER